VPSSSRAAGRAISEMRGAAKVSLQATAPLKRRPPSAQQTATRYVPDIKSPLL